MCMDMDKHIHMYMRMDMYMSMDMYMDECMYMSQTAYLSIISYCFSSGRRAFEYYPRTSQSSECERPAYWPAKVRATSSAPGQAEGVNSVMTSLRWRRRCSTSPGTYSLSAAWSEYLHARVRGVHPFRLPLTAPELVLALVPAVLVLYARTATPFVPTLPLTPGQDGNSLPPYS